MAPRDYASRGSRKKTKKKPYLLIFIAFLIIIGFAMVLYFLKEKASNVEIESTIPVEKDSPKAVLPTPPKEVWSYIKALETRIVPVDDNPESLDKNLQLTEEQKQVLIQMEKEQREAEIARSKQAQEKQLNEEQSFAIDSEERNIIETRRKAAAERKQQEEQMVLEYKQNQEKTLDEKRRTEQAKVVLAQGSRSEIEKSEKQFGLQCGAFKNKAQAEKVQASLAMIGFNARLTTSADWNRVVIGPVGNRNQANEALSRAKSVTNCVLIAM